MGLANKRRCMDARRTGRECQNAVFSRKLLKRKVIMGGGGEKLNTGHGTKIATMFEVNGMSPTAVEEKRDGMYLRTRNY